jgi:hypothetical protein
MVRMLAWSLSGRGKEVLTLLCHYVGLSDTAFGGTNKFFTEGASVAMLSSIVAVDGGGDGEPRVAPRMN